jgi:hypothetical protein
VSPVRGYSPGPAIQYSTSPPTTGSYAYASTPSPTTGSSTQPTTVAQQTAYYSGTTTILSTAAGSQQTILTASPQQSAGIFSFSPANMITMKGQKVNQLSFAPLKVASAQGEENISNNNHSGVSGGHTMTIINEAPTGHMIHGLSSNG